MNNIFFEVLEPIDTVVHIPNIRMYQYASSEKQCMFTEWVHEFVEFMLEDIDSWFLRFTGWINGYISLQYFIF